MRRVIKKEGVFYKICFRVDLFWLMLMTHVIGIKALYCCSVAFYISLDIEYFFPRCNSYQLIKIMTYDWLKIFAELN